jgi:hypothetical protein
MSQAVPAICVDDMTADGVNEELIVTYVNGRMPSNYP